MEKFKDLFVESRARTLLIISVLVVALAVPITVRLVGEQQDLRQRANFGASLPADRDYPASHPGSPEDKDNGEKCSSHSQCKSNFCKPTYRNGSLVEVCAANAPQDDDEDEKECGSWYSAGGSCTFYDGQNNTEQGEEWKRTCTINGDEIIETKCEASSDSNTGDEEEEEENNEDVDCNRKGFACGPGVQCCAGLYCGSGMCKESGGGGDSEDEDDGDPVSNPGRGGSTDSPWWRPGGSSGGDTDNSENNTSQPNPTATRTPTPTQVPACGVSCTTANACAGAPNGCTVCEGIPLSGGTILFGSCKRGTNTTPTVTKTISPTRSASPSPTPTPTTPAGACGTRCTADSECGGAGDGCGTCTFVGQTRRMTCQRNGITPTPSAGPNDVSLTLNLRMPGIGENAGDNPSPNNTNRTTQALIYNSNNEEVGNTSGTSKFDGSSTYTATLSSSQVPGGVYYLKARLDNTLMTRIPGVIQLTEGQTTNTPLTTLIPGDLNADNILDVRDYNRFIACYGDLQCAEKSLSDFNDDGEVGPVDYNILLRSFAIREGD